MKAVNDIHTQHVHKRRVTRLCQYFSDLIPADSKVLDIGSGDGLLAGLIAKNRPDTTITGVDTLVRPETHIPVTQFDGLVLPFEDKSFDVAMFVDVLHHTDDPNILLREAVRIAASAVVIKDHTMDGFLAYPTLRFMDWVGNAKYGVALPYNYWPESKWKKAFGELGLTPEIWINDLGLYPGVADAFFGRTLHFVARLKTPDPGTR